MSLPDLALQIIYSRLAWALVLAALLLALLPTMLAARPVRQAFGHIPPAGRRTQWLIVAAALALMALPGPASPAFWLTLAFQSPSALLFGFSVVSLAARWRAQPVQFVLPPPLALGLTVIGLVLYLDVFGVLALGLYYGGFHPVAAPLLACAAALGFAVNAWRGHAAGASAAMLIAVLLFSLLRLPTGNLWDSLFDPLLWSWAVGSTIAAARRQLALRRTARRQLAEKPGSQGEQPELAQARATK